MEILNEPPLEDKTLGKPNIIATKIHEFSNEVILKDLRVPNSIMLSKPQQVAIEIKVY